MGNPVAPNISMISTGDFIRSRSGAEFGIFLFHFIFHLSGDLPDVLLDMCPFARVSRPPFTGNPTASKVGLVMLVVIGLLVVLAAVIVGVVGVVSNAGSEHLLTDGFAVFNYHVTGSTGTVLLYGILIGAVGLAGLSLMLAGATRAAGRGRAARAELKRTQQGAELVNRDRDRLLERRHEGHGTNDTANTNRSSFRRWWGRHGSDNAKPGAVPPTK